MSNQWGRSGPVNPQFAALRTPVRASAPSQPAAAVAPPPMLEQPARSLRRDFFIYPILFENLASGGTAQQALQIQADSDFELQKMTTFVVIDGAGASQEQATRVIPSASVQITDTGTGRQLFSAPVPMGGIFGDGQLPFILPTTKMFTKNASVTFQVTNFSDDDYLSLWLLMIGSKIFAY